MREVAAARFRCLGVGSMAKPLWGAGGVAAFLVPAAVIAWPATAAVSDIDRDLLFKLATEVAVPVLALVVLAATKSFFDAKAYRSANVVILALMLAIVSSMVSSWIKEGSAILLIAENDGPIVFPVGLSHLAGSDFPFRWGFSSSDSSASLAEKLGSLRESCTS